MKVSWLARNHALTRAESAVIAYHVGGVYRVAVLVVVSSNQERCASNEVRNLVGRNLRRQASKCGLAASTWGEGEASGFSGESSKFQALEEVCAPV